MFLPASEFVREYVSIQRLYSGRGLVAEAAVVAVVVTGLAL